MQSIFENTNEIEDTLKSISLRYVSDAIPGITRRKIGKNFIYYKQDEQLKDPHVLNRIESLVIPPAWEHVWIAPTGNGHIQATGRDEKGRKQYIYHEDWHKLMQLNKFNKMISFGEILPDLRQEILAGMKERGLTQRKIISTVIWLLEKTYIRIGNEEYATENKSYGLTTMRMKHVDVVGDRVTFEFKGKSGKFHSVEIEDPRVAKTIRKLEELPGYELFQYVDSDGKRQTIESSDINDFLKRITGDEITAKDFRTWGGSVHAAENLYNEGIFQNKKDASKKIANAIKQVSKHLGNTTTVCRTYYIHPTVIKSYEKKELIPHFEREMKKYTNKNKLNRNEHILHSLLKDNS